MRGVRGKMIAEEKGGKRWFVILFEKINIEKKGMGESGAFLV